MKKLMAFIVAGGVLAGCGPTEEAEEPLATYALTMENISTGGEITLSDGSTTDWVFAPGVIVVHEAGVSPFESGAMASDGLEALAEEGDNSVLLTELEGGDGIALVRSLAAEDQETYEETALMPQGKANTVVEVPDGYRVSVVMMFAMSNDTFVGTPPEGVDVPAGATMADISSELAFWDAGTEVNEEPGLGEHQPGASKGTGSDEMGVVARVDGEGPNGFEYPAVAEVIRVQIAAWGSVADER